MVSTVSGHQRAETSPLYHRWRAILPESCQPPHIPEVLLAAYFEAAQANTLPSVAQIAALLPCDTAEAEHWQLVLTTRLISSTFYVPVFTAEDALSDRRIQRTQYELEVTETTARLAALDKEISTTKLYAMLGEPQAAEVESKIASLDQERIDLLRHQADLPTMARLLKEGEAEDTQRLVRSKARVQSAQAAHVTALEQAWREELRTLLAPVTALLERARQHLDPAWALQGRDLRNCGSARLRGEVVQQLRGEHTNA